MKLPSHKVHSVFIIKIKNKFSEIIFFASELIF